MSVNEIEGGLVLVVATFDKSKLAIFLVFKLNGGSLHKEWEWEIENRSKTCD